LQPFRSVVALLLVGAALFPAAIGSQASPPASHSTQSLSSPARNNHTSRRSLYLHAWPTFPIYVYFVHDDNYSKRREACARRGFDSWVEATDGFIDYTVTANRDKAQIVVRFNPDTANGITEQRFRGNTMRSAHISLGAREGVGYDMEAVAAHEFGHALGIGSHSPNEHDLMFPVHVAGTSYCITEHDLHTLATAYPALAKRLAANAPIPSP